jgi:hypothetical protein
MTYSSPCKDCRHSITSEIVHGLFGEALFVDDCEEEAPEDVFGSEWGCYRYEKRPEINED